jgi:hypothetical protein
LEVDVNVVIVEGVRWRRHLVRVVQNGKSRMVKELQGAVRL